MADSDDPFTGTWKFSATRSRLDTSIPEKWVQEIVATRDEIVVHEDIVRLKGPRTAIRVWARFDGTDYPVSGSLIIDTIAYTRLNTHTISGVGKKGEVMALTETVTVSPDGRILTLIYSIQTGTSPIVRGVAVFEK
jgi:hypothetical protein